MIFILGKQRVCVHKRQNLLGQNPKTFSKSVCEVKDLQITFFVTAFDFALALLVGFLFSPKINFVKNKNSLGGKEK
ncbi:TPA: hypothetical protein ACGPAV_002214 [Streptococcus suis]